MIVDFLKTFFLVFFILMNFYITDVKGNSVLGLEDEYQTGFKKFQIVADEGFVAANKTDLCELNPCENNGSCIVLEGHMNGSYYKVDWCICPDGYSERYCQTDICSDCENSFGNDTVCLVYHGLTRCFSKANIPEPKNQTAVFMRNCEETGGYITRERYGRIQCKCPEKSIFDPMNGCRNATTCDIYKMRNCEETGGYCTREKNGRIQCNCPEKSTFDYMDGCRSNSCRNLTCVNNGVCIIMEKEVCICPLGFRGERCEIIDRNASTCIWYFKDCEETGGYCTVDENYEFKCVCPNGTRYLSRHGCLANKDIRNCPQDMRNCENLGGYCTTNRYQVILCKCPGNQKYIYGYGCAHVDDATNCSLYMRNCEETGGYCARERYVGIQCKCPENSTYEPKYGCRKVCYDRLCENGGTCIVERGKFKCVCKESFVGKFCETDLCRRNFCENGGMCRVEEGVAKCYCKEPYGGKYCDIRMDPCIRNYYCQNGGLCRNRTTGIPECFCMEPYSGKYCETRRDPSKMTVTFAVICSVAVIISSIVTSVICLCCHRIAKAKK